MMPVHRFAPSAGSVPAVRRFVSDSLAGVDESQREIVLLVVSELATNAVLHSGTDFEVNVDTSGDDVRVEVSDAGPGEPVMLEPPPEAPHGRGLQIVNGLASSWGVTPGPAPAGKTVWVSVVAPS
jgi:anti-sigma regulatory factor (Ser/Thr protein kinase)